jgi:hypothetical protein
LFTLRSVAFVSQRQNPSWCLVVKTMYFIPASLAVFTQSAALNNTGLNSWYKLS